MDAIDLKIKCALEQFEECEKVFNTLASGCADWTANVQLKAALEDARKTMEDYARYQWGYGRAPKMR